MRYFSYLVLSFVLLSCFIFSLVSTSPAADQTTVTVEGNVVCLLPDYEKGTVNPVIANGPCTNDPPHEHILVSKDNKVYAFIYLTNPRIRESGPERFVFI